MSDTQKLRLDLPLVLAIKEGNEVKYVVWRFDTLSLQPFDLGTVVPSLAARSVKVYVARSHLDRN